MQHTARLMAQWQAVGFMHGVMNTDNMSILGLTLDYGPYGFMDGFNASHICNHTDTAGRYAWNAQPMVAHWNLYRLAEALYPLVGQTEPLYAVLNDYEDEFLGHFNAILAAKLGLREFLSGDEALMEELWRLMHTQRADFTLTFRRLASVATTTEEEQQEPAGIASALPSSMEGTTSWEASDIGFEGLFHEPAPVRAWLKQYRARLRQDNRPTAERREAMLRTNPLYVLRNHLAEIAIRATAAGDPSEIERLMTVLRDPYTEKPGFEDYASLPPEWAGSLAISCSS